MFLFLFLCFFGSIINQAVDDGEVTSVNVVSAVSLKTRVIGADMEHQGLVMIPQSGGLLFVSELQQLNDLSTLLYLFLHVSM